MNRIKTAALLSLILCTSPALATSLKEIINSPHRGASASRDQYRHPVETLTFFDVQPQMTVVEIWPGPKGWYTEILAPYLRDEGTFYAAHFNADSPAAFYRNSLEQFKDKLQASPDLYDKVKITTFNPPEYTNIAPEGSADRVLTFRNVHNWYMRGGGDERVLAAFRAFHKALKPGGILGVVEHRLPESRPESDQEASGYMHTDYVIRMAEKAGFKLLDSSEINANPADNTRHPEGVWTLPPTLRLGETDKKHYLSIGESDRMTLKFMKVDR
ncbi:MAG: methyltransferase [Ketobacteraceae bacterium]|nr:methyltransferase [Ketobacteraceae bacterium]